MVFPILLEIHAEISKMKGQIYKGMSSKVLTGKFKFIF